MHLPQAKYTRFSSKHAALTKTDQMLKIKVSINLKELKLCAVASLNTGKKGKKIHEKLPIICKVSNTFLSSQWVSETEKYFELNEN